MQQGQATSSGSGSASKHMTHTTPQNPGPHGTGKGKGRAQSRGSSHPTVFPSISSVASVSSVTTSSAATERLASPPTPTPSHVRAHSSRPRSPPVIPVGIGRSPVQSSAGALEQGVATPRSHNRRSRDAGFYARQVVSAYRYPFGIFPIIASVQAESAPEDWSSELGRRINDSTPEFISALVDGMRQDLGLPHLPK